MKALPLLAAAVLAACAHRPAPPMADPQSLAAAETAFAAHSVREDMRVAFLAAFDADGVFVRNGWVVSNDDLRPRAAPPIVLDWRPQYVEVAPSGEMGLSTGPSRITSKTQPDTPPTHGQFVSVWRRDGSGTWKVAVDLGILHPEPHLWNEPLEARVSPTAASPSAGSLVDAEARFARDALERGARAAYEQHGARDMRLYRSGTPLRGRDAALSIIPPGEKRHAWKVERSETARSGDFGYARGSFAEPGATAPLGWYLRVWRREAPGWRIVMDVVNPAPKR